MYELPDWGRPAPAEWVEPRERLDLRLPPSLVRELRARARSDSVNVSVVVERMLREAMHLVPIGRYVD